MPSIVATRNPCIACGKQETLGVAYGHPEEIKFWCARCLPDEFRSVVRQRSDQDMFDAYASLEAAKDAAIWAQEAKLREGSDD